MQSLTARFCRNKGQLDDFRFVSIFLARLVLFIVIYSINSLVSASSVQKKFISIQNFLIY